MSYPFPLGDKKHSAFFYEFLPKIYDRKKTSGLDQMIGRMRAIVMQIQYDTLLSYMTELYTMTPYRVHSSYQTNTHKICVLRINTDQPDLIVLSPLSENYFDKFSAINQIYAGSREKHHIRYIGEIYHCHNLNEVKKTLTEQGVQFMDDEKIQNDVLSEERLLTTQASYYTHNCVMYTEKDLSYYDHVSRPTWKLPDHRTNQLNKACDHYHTYNLHTLLLGIDHLATRVFSDQRENAILEYVSLTNYYFWGAYSIDEMNSSTNITRSGFEDNELFCPAKVFTANNTPSYVTSIEKKPSPTEDFVREMGQRMHHIAYAVKDGKQDNEMKNVDYVIDILQKEGVAFLLHTIGECAELPDLKQIFSASSPYSYLITEYIQRCHGFDGFFTKENVGTLTKAAGADVRLHHHGVSD